MQTIHTKIKVKRIFSLILVALSMLIFSGCYDLGKFEDDESYYSSFGDVRLINQEGATSAKDYSFKDYFYNEKSINDFAGDIVESSEYIYLVLPAKSDFFLSEFSVYLKSEQVGKLYFSLFITDSIPENIRRYNDPKTKEKKNDAGEVIYDSEGNPVLEDISYGDLSIEDSIYQGSVGLISGKWTSFTAKLMTKHSTDKIKYSVANGDYIIVRFENNSGLGFDEGYNKLSFSLTNLLIRAL